MTDKNEEDFSKLKVSLKKLERLSTAAYENISLCEDDFSFEELKNKSMSHYIDILHFIRKVVGDESYLKIIGKAQ